MEDYSKELHRIAKALRGIEEILSDICLVLKGEAEEEEENE